MYIRIALATLVLWCAGCAQEPSPKATAHHPLDSAASSSSLARSLSSGTSRAHRSFANAEDRGDLVAYPSTPVVKHDGAYTWHRAGLSEDHALGAIDGVLTITAPSGEKLQFAYERHVEHPSGDWTWVGRAKKGAASDEVILTFGDHAAFGTISQPGKAPLKLTVDNGVSWLIETDRSKIAGIDNPATRPRNPDFLIPPKMAAAPGAFSMESAPPIAASTSAAANTQAAVTTVDVLLGYTAGFAAAQGGASQAVTRLYNLVEVTNQAYVNSQVGARVRLVHALQVNYPDATSNQSALEALTGFRAPSTRTTPDPAFAALRAARDQYGADLVSLVRQFKSPESDGCGIAWLIGGGQTGIDSSDEHFGYSIVSDGRDAGTDGKTYFCREESLAHELAHNMGSQHDRSTATVDGTLKHGVYPYSFGYKTASGSGNFYTIMAYGDEGQDDYRVFSNPRTSFCSQPPPAPQYACGVDGQADNARSLVATIPTISGFRAQIVPSTPVTKARQDLDGDGKSDLLWYHPGGQEVGYWMMNGSSILRSGSQLSGGGYRVITTGDYNGDAKEDLVWLGPDGDMQMWMSNGSGFGWAPFVYYPSGWTLVASRDVDGDGKSDLIWYHPVAQQIAYWTMNGSAITRQGGQLSGGNYRVLAAGDYNGDGKADIVWRGPDGDLQMWQSNGFTFDWKPFVAYPAGWSLLGSHDVDGDGKTDLLWYHPGAQLVAYWILDGSRIARHGSQASGGGYRVLAMGDYNGDAKSDLIWKGPDGDMQMWFSNGVTFDWKPLAMYPAGWNSLSTLP